ncbi:GDYXXLXY domain-containing protein [Paludifilum halophilum]|uniref:GDYXXLXY domain-containing protein n=1 Tax=Paludifilum halophilum TaxID=1642702 RepID=A0A235B5E0_9BACL|nr:GDYXXLXY domain-containing protein [Paludifilum halophilum]OYD07179.1 hypothetical protein CHM34_12390 [Paludifilum halophilum]
MNRRRWLALLITAQVLLLGGIAGSYYAVDAMGKEIQLRTKPVDPRNLLYGDYAHLHYEISDVPRQLWRGDEESLQNEPVHVLLSPQKTIYRVKGVYPDRPETSEEEVVLQAKASSFGEQIHLKYGLERYYVPENTGKTLEGQRRPMRVRVKVAPWGQAKISALEPYPEKSSTYR